MGLTGPGSRIKVQGPEVQMNKCHPARACERLAPELLGVVGADACDRGVGSRMRTQHGVRDMIYYKNL